MMLLVNGPNMTRAEIRAIKTGRDIAPSRLAVPRFPISPPKFHSFFTRRGLPRSIRPTVQSLLRYPEVAAAAAARAMQRRR